MYSIVHIVLYKRQRQWRLNYIFVMMLTYNVSKFKIYFFDNVHKFINKNINSQFDFAIK